MPSRRPAINHAAACAGGPTSLARVSKNPRWLLPRDLTAAMDCLPNPPITTVVVPTAREQVAVDV